MNVKVKELSLEEFRKYGAYADMLNPDGIKIGESPIEFYRDALPFSLGQMTAPSLSVCRVGSRPYVIDMSEYHSATSEINLPLDGDMLMHVAPASAENKIDPAQVEVFRIPKGTAVMIYPGVWHHAAFTVDTEAVLVLVVLPQRTYANDSFVYSIPKEDQIQIER